jgi:hypothetical protein
MDHREEHHQHHRKEREERKKEERLRGAEAERRPIHRSPMFWVGVAVVAAAVLAWTLLS